MTSLFLAPIRSEDAEPIAAWITDATLLFEWAGPAGFEFPLDPDVLRAHWGRSAEENPTRRCLRAQGADGSLLGYGELGAIDRAHGGGRLSRLLVGDPDARGRGLGGALVDALLRVAFEQERLHRVELGVFEHNRAAIRCYERTGFRHEGTRRECQRVGDAWWNSRVMGILVHEWRSRAANPAR